MPIKISLDLIYRNTTKLRIREFMSSSNSKRVGCCKLDTKFNMYFKERFRSYQAVNSPPIGYKTCRLMLYRERAYHGL